MPWGFGLAMLLGGVGYLVAMISGTLRLNSYGLTPWLPSFWLAVAFARANRLGAPSIRLRASVVRSVIDASLGLASAGATWAMLSSNLFRPGHRGDNPGAPIGALFGCMLIPVVPFVAAAAHVCFRRGNTVTRASLRHLTLASTALLAALVTMAGLRHMRAPDIARWLQHPPETLSVPSFFARSSAWEALPRDAEGARWYRHRELGMIFDAALTGNAGWCDLRVTFSPPTAEPTQARIFTPCIQGLRFGLDREAQLLILPPQRLGAALDFGRRRVVRTLREIRRPLAPVPEWTFGGAVALVWSLAVLRRGARRPHTLDRAAWRTARWRSEERAIVFDDGGLPLAARSLPCEEGAPLIVSRRGEHLGPGYRDVQLADERAIIVGTFEEIELALRDGRDVMWARVLAVTCVAAAPLAASWWAGLL